MNNFHDLVNKNQGLVKKIALSISRRIRTRVSLDDLIAYGQLGLIQAARAFTPNSTAKFSTYAYYRITGAIYDGLWQMDWSSRSEYAKVKAGHFANELLESETDENDCDTTQNESNEQSAIKEEINWANRTISGLAVIYFFSGLATQENAFDVEGPDSDPQAELELQELKDKLLSLIDDLPKIERELVDLCYFQNHSISQGASKLGKSRSWGSRTHSIILEKLSRKFVELEVQS